MPFPDLPFPDIAKHVRGIYQQNIADVTKQLKPNCPPG